MSKLSVLAITSELPWPLNTGGRLRSFHLLTGLAGSLQIQLIAGATEAAHDGVVALAARGIDVVPVALPPRRRWREAGRILQAAASGEPYVLFRRHDRPEMREAVRRAVRNRRPDVVYFDHLDSALFGEDVPGAREIADLHNVYSLIARRAADEHPSAPARAYLRHQSVLLGREERRLARRADVIFSVSEQERRYFERLGASRTALVPNGVDCAAYAGLPTGRLTSDPIILYIGALSWAPNASAAMFLAEHVLPAVRARIPQATLRIVGKHPPASLLARHGRDGVEVLGGVPDVRPYLETAALLAVPLKTGGGTRLKILEAFAAGLPVVSTTVGAEGIACESGRHLLIAERDGFADAVVMALRDRATAARMADDARAVVRNTYDWPVVVASASAAINQAFGTRPQAIPQPMTGVRVVPAAEGHFGATSL